MSQYPSSSNNNYSHTPATTATYNPYHTLPNNPTPNQLPPPPPPPPTKSSHSGYSNHRQSSSHHTDYRYHPYHQNRLYTPTATTTTQQSSYPYINSNKYSSSQSNLNTLTPYNSHNNNNSYNNRYKSSSASNLHGHSFNKYGGGGHHNNSHGGHGGHKPKKQKAPRNEFGIPYGQPGAGLVAPDWNNIELPLFQKNFYRECESITLQSNMDVVKWRKERDIVVIGDKIPRPIRTFNEAGFPSYIMTEIERSGFIDPTPIQSQGWPMAMSGRDVIGIAETGSGKTLAFLLPCIVHINAQPLLRPGDGPIVLIIAPTRELAIQIEGEARKFAYSSKIKHCCVYGGVSRRDQIRNLRIGVEIIICTPGRLLDFLESSHTNLRRVTYLVIDEADRLLDMGFEPQLSSILSQVRPDRQILMWSATWPKEVRELSKKYFLSNDVIQVSIGQPLNQNGTIDCDNLRANHNVHQIIDCFDNNYEKQDNLYKILRKEKGNVNKYLIFASTKKQCDYLYKLLKTDGFCVAVIHGDKQQYERDSALLSFKNGQNNIMIATDVASRGIHINNIYMVINYDFPQNIEDYIHRIGRTGRCGNKGTAISFFTKNDIKRANKLINILKEAKQEVPKKLIQYSQMSYSQHSSNNRSRYNR